MSGRGSGIATGAGGTACSGRTSGTGGHPERLDRRLLTSAACLLAVVAFALTGFALPGRPLPGTPPVPTAAPERLGLALAAPGAPAPSAHRAAARALPPRGSWSWPVPAPRLVLRHFHLPDPYAAGHRGADLSAEPGTAVSAVADGVVRFAGTVAGRPVLSIEHAEGLVSSYEPVDALLAAGDPVRAGERIGTLSGTVRHPPHGGLHLGARLDGAYLDPVPLLAAPPAAVLLPLDDDPRVRGSGHGPPRIPGAQARGWARR